MNTTLGVLASSRFPQAACGANSSMGVGRLKVVELKRCDLMANLQPPPQSLVLSERMRRELVVL